MDDFSPVPDIEFMKKLNAFDKTLIVSWDRSQRIWQIWRRDPDTYNVNFILSVVGEDGLYRPLDDRTLQILKMNRFYAENPKLVEKMFIEEPARKLEKATENTLDNLKSVSKDKSLIKDFTRIRDLAGSVPKEKWDKPVFRKDGRGKVIYGPDGRPIYAYKPHNSWSGGVK